MHNRAVIFLHEKCTNSGIAWRWLCKANLTRLFGCGVQFCTHAELKSVSDYLNGISVRYNNYYGHDLSLRRTRLYNWCPYNERATVANAANYLHMTEVSLPQRADSHLRSYTLPSLQTVYILRSNELITSKMDDVRTSPRFKTCCACPGSTSMSICIDRLRRSIVRRIRSGLPRVDIRLDTFLLSLVLANFCVLYLRGFGLFQMLPSLRCFLPCLVVSQNLLRLQNRLRAKSVHCSM